MSKKGFQMNIKDIKYYCALVKTKNFSKVAEQFSVSQPTITLAIKRLEKAFDTTFFIRDQSHRELRITEAGQQFFLHAQVILNELTVARQEIAHANDRQIRFGLPPIIGNFYFPPLTPQLMQAGLMAQLEPYEYGSAHLLKMVQKGELDLALLGSLTPISSPQLRTQVLARYPIKIIVAKNHPLAARQANGVAFRELQSQAFITLARENEFVHQQAFRHLAQINHFRPKVLYQTNDVHILKSMVASNLGIAYLTDLALSPSDNVVPIPLTDADQPVFLVSAVMRTTTPLTAAIQALWADLAASK